MSHIVIIETEPHVVAEIDEVLNREPNQVAHARTALGAHQAIQRQLPDLVVLGRLGTMEELLAVCRQLRAAPATARLAILALGRDGSAPVVTAALDAGCDDHLVWPFEPGELAARVRALLRRSLPRPRLSLTFSSDGLSVDVAGRRICLTPTEYDLINVLSMAQGKHMSAEVLLQRVWHYPPGTGDAALVRNHVRNLRMKLEDDPDHPRVLLSHHGRGYSLAVDVVRRSDGSHAWV